MHLVVYIAESKADPSPRIFLNCTSTSSSLTPTLTPARGYSRTRTRVRDSASAKLLPRRHQ